MINIPFNEWLPDQPALGQTGLVSVKNCIPAIKGFLEIRDIAPFTNALASKVLGSFWVQDSNGVIYFFAGDAQSLYQLSGVTFNNVSKVGGYNSERWEFIKWGDRVIAANETDPLQFKDFAAPGGFDDLPGNPPSARHIAVVRDFIVLGFTNDGEDHPSRVQWSGFNSSELWEPDPSTQADFQDLFGRGGQIQKIVPGEVGIIFQEHSIWSMSYAGPPVIFKFDELERGRGTPAPQSVCWTGETIYYLGHDGFYKMVGGQSQAIGANRVDRDILAEINTEFYDQIIGAIDRKKRLVIWAYCDLSSTGTPNKLVIYSWESNRWSTADISCDYLGEWLATGYTLDELDTILANIDSQSINVDSDAFKGGTLSLGFFNTGHRLGLLDGEPLTAEFETGDIGAGEISFLNRVRPLIDGGADVCLQVGGRDEQSKNTVWSRLINKNRIGEFSMRRRSRFHRFKLIIKGGFDYAIALVAYLKNAGDR